MTLPSSSNPNSWQSRKGRLSGEFRSLIGTKVVPSDPSRNLNPNGTVQTQTAKSGRVEGLVPSAGVPYSLNEDLLGSAGLTPSGGEFTFTVSNNTFNGLVVIQIGDHKVVYGVDFLAGGTPAATATNIVAAINALPYQRYVASNGGTAVVSVRSDVAVSKTYCKITHYGTNINLDTVEVSGSSAPGTGTAKVEGFAGHTGTGGSERFGSLSNLTGPELT